MPVVASTQDVARVDAYRKLKDALTDKGIPRDEIDALLDDSSLTDYDIRNLFGIILKAFLDVLWLLREGQLWIIRAETFGAECAQSGSAEAITDSNGLRAAFRRDMDEQFEMAGIYRLFFKAEILNISHVTGYRETCANLDHVLAKKAEILQAAVLGSRSLEAD